MEFTVAIGSHHLSATSQMRSLSEFRDNGSVSWRKAISILSVIIPAFASCSRDFGWMVLFDQKRQSTVDSTLVAQELKLAPDGGQVQVIDAAVGLAAANQVNTLDLTLQRRNDFEIRNVGRGDRLVHRISWLRLVARKRCQGPRRTQQCPKQRRQSFLRTDSWPQHTPGGGRSDRRHSVEQEYS